MSLKKIKIINLFVAFILCFPLHFLYEMLPNTLFSIILPVNESIWEHLKLILTSYVLAGTIDFILLKKYTKVNNFLLQLFISPLLSIIIFLIIYLPLYNIFGEVLILNIVLLFLIIIVEEIISYYILNLKEIKHQGIIGIVGIISLYIIFGYLTYNPLINYVFFDTHNNKYGINTYIFD